MSMIGVPSTASRSRTSNLVPDLPVIRTRCNPIGFGRSGARVLRTPCRGLVGSPRGWRTSTSRRARWNHVNTKISSPTSRPQRPSAIASRSARTADGDPSSPCLGADRVSTRGDSTYPMARTANVPGSTVSTPDVAWNPRRAQSWSAMRAWCSSSAAGADVSKIMRDEASLPSTIACHSWRSIFPLPSGVRTLIS
jgi:hypothetical protein